jgi:hypothetical protein
VGRSLTKTVLRLFTENILLVGATATVVPKKYHMIEPSEGWGGVAINDDCSLMVCIDNVHVFVRDVALQITVNAYKHDMKDPRFACFVSHDTFVAIDGELWHSEDGGKTKAGYKLKEFSVAGKHVQTIVFPRLLMGVAYYAPKNLLAVTMGGSPPLDHFLVMDYTIHEIQSFGKARGATGNPFHTRWSVCSHSRVD